MTVPDGQCPVCGGTLTLDLTAAIEVPTYSEWRVVIRPRPAVVVFCDGCEWSWEVDMQGGNVQ